MRYHSTRGGPESSSSFEEVLLSAYARDGGLYVPDRIPSLTTADQLQRYIDEKYDFPRICAEVVHLYSDIDIDALLAMTSTAFSQFNQTTTADHDQPITSPTVAKEVLPMYFLEDKNVHLLDLSLGPTYAFKDIGQQMCGQLLNYYLGRRNQKAKVCVDTSGDTGPAAIAGVRGCSNVEIYCLYPRGRVTPIQELQMITVLDANVHVYRTDGDSDEQASVLKELFQDEQFMRTHNICCVNSINWARIAVQSSYYIWSYVSLCQRGLITQGEAMVNYAIPTGAFGNAMGCYLAKLMGIPIRRIYCATNNNDIVHRTLSSGDMRMGENIQTESPAMDIQFAYNVERMLYYVFEEDSDKLKHVMSKMELQTSTSAEHVEVDELGRSSASSCQLDPGDVDRIHQIFTSYSVSDEQTIEAIAMIHESHQILLCPHSATAVYAVLHPFRDRIKEEHAVTTISVITAHPCKFERAIVKAVGERPPYPADIQDLLSKPQRFTCLEKQPSSNPAVWRKAWIDALRRDIELS